MAWILGQMRIEDFHHHTTVQGGMLTDEHLGHTSTPDPLLDINLG
jgi:hypothetical protein